MHSILAPVAVVALATAAYAAPTVNIQGRSTFSVNQVPGPKKVYKNGAASIVKTYNKYAKFGGVAPQSLVKAAAAVADAEGQTGSAEADPEQYDEAYLVEVQVGEQTLNLDFDTGSSDLWVFSTVTPSNEAGSHNLYNPNDSGSLEQGETWQISYGDGSGASGIVYADQVVVGGVTATQQAVEAATSVSAEFEQDPSDGLLGLAFSFINTVQPNQATTFFDTVKDTLAEPLFTADLKHKAPGSYDFGYIDSSKYTGKITYTDVDNSNGFWQFTAGGFGVNSKKTSGSIGTSIADTGTTLWYVPDNVVSAYYAKVPSASNSEEDGGYVFPCGTSLPSLSVEIGGSVFTVPGSYLQYAPASPGSSTCLGGLQSSDGIGLNIFGDIFLKAIFAVFSETESNPRLGFASKST